MGRLSLLASLLLVANDVLGAKWIGEVKTVEGIDYQCKQTPVSCEERHILTLRPRQMLL